MFVCKSQIAGWNELFDFTSYDLILLISINKKEQYTPFIIFAQMFILSCIVYNFLEVHTGFPFVQMKYRRLHLNYNVT